MKLEDITQVVCVSCVLVFFCVSSQSTCYHGWFGDACKYRCRCENESCDVNGSCITPYKCVSGWFGPACQYADIAYLISNSTATLTVITDDDDTTCNVNAGDIITIPFGQSIFFTWLRIVVSDQGSDALESLTATFSSSTSSVPCPTWRKQTVSKTTLDMHCDISQTVTDMTLAGPAVPHLCSVYVSGGRNVALVERAWQANEYAQHIGGSFVYFVASRAVDGDTRQELSSGSCAVTSFNVPWILTLSRQRRIHRFVIYNRSDAALYRLVGFKLQSYDYGNNSVFVHQDTGNVPKLIYTIVQSPLFVKMVVITANYSVDRLTLCEVEVYGDSICDPQHFGRECEHPCRCANNETCFVDTGGCPSGCAAGFSGEGCIEECPVGQYGKNCNESCSPSCAPSNQANMSSCDIRTGVCVSGCQSGFLGDLCKRGCDVGAFGMNCTESCSPKCVSSGQANVTTCDIGTGTCLLGCQSGFTGDLCNRNCSAGQFGRNCNESCSPKCVDSVQENVTSCDMKTGTCLKGCQSGFSGALCRDCIAGKFGLDCSQSCSPQCVDSDQANVSSCDMKTGACIKGCQSGFSGATCRGTVAAAAAAAAASVPMNLILGLGALVSVMFVAALCVKRKGQSSQAIEGARPNAYPE